jgi:hypothetical protein
MTVWIWVGALVGLLAVFGLAVRLVTKPRSLALPPPKTRSCQKCVHWDHEEGQRALRRNPAFWQAAQTLSANKMSRGGVDAEGVPKRGPSLPQVEDRWEYMGACLKRDEVRHRTDTCPNFRSPLTAKLFGTSDAIVPPPSPLADALEPSEREGTQYVSTEDKRGDAP